MHYVAIDVETTGIEPGSRMTELGAVIFDGSGEIVDQFEQLVDPGMTLPKDVVQLNGITNEMLARKPDAGTVLGDFFDWLQGDFVLIAYKAPYDTGVISWEAGRYDIDIPEFGVIDALGIAREMSETKDNKLATLAKHYGLIGVGLGEKNHRALHDSYLCMEYFNLIRPRAGSLTVLPWDKAGHNYSYTDNFPDELSMLPELVEKADPLTFTYTDAQKKTTMRTITPYGWALKPSGLMFHGMCHLRKERRTFLAERVVGVMKQEQIVETSVA